MHGKGKDQYGRRGQSLEVTVPIGTTVRDLYTGELLAELVNQGDRWLAAAGGRGGRGNHKFLSNKRRAPSFAEQGEHGEERWLKLELKLMADAPGGIFLLDQELGQRTFAPPAAGDSAAG